MAIDTQYGKFAGNSVAFLVATSIVETVDQYLTTPLPNSAVLAITAVLSLAAVYLVPHSLVGSPPTNPTEPEIPANLQGH